jgi:hypothetical protein
LPAQSRSPDSGLAFVDVESILCRLDDLTEAIVLVGGQAVNFCMALISRGTSTP